MPAEAAGTPDQPPEPAPPPSSSGEATVQGDGRLSQAGADGEVEGAAADREVEGAAADREVQAPDREVQRRAPDPEVQGGALLLADWGTAFALLNHGRRLAIGRVFGLHGQDANIATVIALALMARAARDRAHRLTDGVTPSGPDAFLGLAAVRETIVSIAGPATRQMPGVPGLIMIGVVGAAAGPAVAKAVKRVRGGSQRMNTGFHHRYGYLVDPGHRRQGRADRRQATTGDLTPVPDVTATDQ